MVIEKPIVVVVDKPIDVVSVIEIVEVCPSYDQYHSEYDVKSAASFQQNVSTIVSQLRVTPDAEYIYVNNSNRGVLCDEESETFDEDDADDENEDRGGHGGGNPIKPCKIVSGWKCPKFGYYKHPTHCQKYVRCKYCGDNSVYMCGHDDCYDGKRCSSDWSTCGELPKCMKHGHLLRDPWNKHGYFICWKKKGFPKKHRVYRRECFNKFIFDVHKQRCVRPIWSKHWEWMKYEAQSLIHHTLWPTQIMYHLLIIYCTEDFLVHFLRIKFPLQASPMPYQAYRKLNFSLYNSHFDWFAFSLLRDGPVSYVCTSLIQIGTSCRSGRSYMHLWRHCGCRNAPLTWCCPENLCRRRCIWSVPWSRPCAPFCVWPTLFDSARHGRRLSRFGVLARDEPLNQIWHYLFIFSNFWMSKFNNAPTICIRMESLCFNLENDTSRGQKSKWRNVNRKRN